MITIGRETTYHFSKMTLRAVFDDQSVFPFLSKADWDLREKALEKAAEFGIDPNSFSDEQRKALREPFGKGGWTFKSMNEMVLQGSPFARKDYNTWETNRGFDWTSALIELSTAFPEGRFEVLIESGGRIYTPLIEYYKAGEFYSPKISYSAEPFDPRDLENKKTNALSWFRRDQVLKNRGIKHTNTRVNRY